MELKKECQECENYFKGTNVLVEDASKVENQYEVENNSEVKNKSHGTDVLDTKEYYKQRIVEIVNKIGDAGLLKRIYNLAEYLYIHK